MILDNSQEFPPDIRVEKEIKALKSAGHEIFLLTPKHKPDSLAVEYLDDLGVTVCRVGLGAVKGKYFANAWRGITMFDGRWLQVAKEFVEMYKIEALHVHDLFTVPVIVKVGKEKKIPVVADLHENMPAAMRAIRSVFPLWKRLLMGIIYNYKLMQWNESSALKKCSQIIVVVPEAADRLLRYGIPQDKIHVVSNTEDETTFKFDPSQADLAIKSKYNDKFVISYIGGIGVHRGLDTTLKAMPLIIDKIPNIHFLIVGADKSSKIAIEEIVSNLEISNYVEILSWQPFYTVNSYVMASDICLVPHNDFEHTQTTIPHKLFQYMICGKPVLVSNCRPLKRIIDIANCGVVFKANDEKDLSEKLFLMHSNVVELNNMGIRGQKAALGQLSWKNDAEILKNIYLRLDTID